MPTREMKLIVKAMEEVNHRAYNQMVFGELVSRAKPFTEFLGLMNEHVYIVERLATDDPQFEYTSEGMRVHSPAVVGYIGAQLKQIFGPYILEQLRGQR